MAIGLKPCCRSGICGVRTGGINNRRHGHRFAKLTAVDFAGVQFRYQTGDEIFHDVPPALGGRDSAINFSRCRIGGTRGGSRRLPGHPAKCQSSMVDHEVPWIGMTTPPEEAKPATHGLADHRFGDALDHRHDGQSDHDHDDFEGDGPLEENPLWIQDHVTLTTVGIDIGSSGTQVIFSKIHLRRLSEELTSRYYVVSRETLFLSPVSLTPYQSETRIDDAALKRIIDEAYEAAGIAPADIDTGAVILTGEALRRENAQAISGLLAEAGGDFVCATAGHHMESMLAAYGSGASRVSSESGERILNMDIGGGTTKLALVDSGKVIATAAVHIGGRLQVVDADGRIVRLDPAGATHARRAGFHWRHGVIARRCGTRPRGGVDGRYACFRAVARSCRLRLRPSISPIRCRGSMEFRG